MCREDAVNEGSMRGGTAAAAGALPALEHPQLPSGVSLPQRPGSSVPSTPAAKSEARPQFLRSKLSATASSSAPSSQRNSLDGASPAPSRVRFRLASKPL